MPSSYDNDPFCTTQPRCAGVTPLAAPVRAYEKENPFAPAMVSQEERRRHGTARAATTRSGVAPRGRTAHAGTLVAGRLSFG